MGNGSYPAENRAMQNDRRIFDRNSSTVAGQLQWQVKGRTGLVHTKRLGITTVDLSIDGARVSTEKRAKLPVGASIVISFGEHESHARVRALLPDPNGKPRQQLLLLQFEHPGADFLREIDRMLHEYTGGSEYKSAHWNSVHEDEYGEPDHAFAARGESRPLAKSTIRF